MKPTDFYTFEQTQQSLSRDIVEAVSIELLDTFTTMRLIEELDKEAYLGIDCETRGFAPYLGGLHGVGISSTNRHYYIVAEGNYSNLKWLLNDLNDKVCWILHNAKFDTKWLEVYDIRLKHYHDTYLASYVLNPTAKHKIGALAGEYLNRYPMDFAELVEQYATDSLTLSKGDYYLPTNSDCDTCKGTGQVRGSRRLPGYKSVTIHTDGGNYLTVHNYEGHKTATISWEKLFKPKQCPKCKGTGQVSNSIKVDAIDYLPLDKVGDYCAEDCYEALMLWQILAQKLCDNELYGIYLLELLLMPVLKEMEQRGVAVDIIGLMNVKDELQGYVDFYYSEWCIHFPNVSPNSPTQVLNALNGVGVTISGTDKDTLVKNIKAHPAIEALLEYRKHIKLLQFVDDLMNSEGIVHTSYGFTKTGRISSSNPNLQNIPARSEEGQLIRKCFIPFESDSKIIALDYSAFEYRIIAYLSGDPLLKQCFILGDDFHGKLTGLIFGYRWIWDDDNPPPKAIKAQRTAVKSINYGLAYGMGAQKLANTLNCSVEEAKELMAKHRSLVPGIWEFLHSSRESAVINGYTQTLWGRKRFYTLTSPSLQGLKGNIPYSYLEYLLENKRVNYDDMALLREAMNHPIQGTNADAIKAAKVKVQREVCEKYGAKLLLTVHDELVLEALEGTTLEVYNDTVEIMQGIIDLGDIPVIVSGACADTWGDAK